MKRIIKKTLCLLLSIQLALPVVYMTVNRYIRTDMTVCAEEGEEGGENEDPPADPPEEPSDDEPAEPPEEPPTDPEDEPNDDPATDVSEPENNDNNEDPVTTADTTEDPDGEDSGDEPGDSDDDSFAGGGAVTTRGTKRTKVITDTSSSDETTAVRSEETPVPEIGASAVNEPASAPAAKIKLGKLGAIAAGIAALGAIAGAAVILRRQSGRKEVYDPGTETDESNCPSGALDFNARYGKYNASALTDYENRIILTFDPDYDSTAAEQLLNVLKEKKVSAVFFINKRCIDEQSALVKRMIDEGHIIGNNGVTDASMPDMSGRELTEAIMGLHEQLLQEYGYEMCYFRPPFGEFSRSTLSAAKDYGYSTLMWSYEYINDLPDRNEAIEDIVTCAHSGGVYLFHNVSIDDASVISEAIDELKKKGYEF